MGGVFGLSFQRRDAFGNGESGLESSTPFNWGGQSGTYRDDFSGLYSNAGSNGMAGSYSPQIAQDIDDFPVDENGRDLVHAPLMRGINKGATAGMEGLNFAASLNPIANAATAISGQDASGKCVSTGQRIWSALSMIPASAYAKLIGKAGSAIAKTGAARQRSQIVYRALRVGENPALGLTARAPGANVSVISHVAGKKETPWISTTHSRLRAIFYNFRSRAGIVEIDLSRINTEVIDISSGIPGYEGKQMSNWARWSQEVLIRDRVEPNAILRWYLPPD